VKPPAERIVTDVLDECIRADAKHGDNMALPDGTSHANAALADAAKADTDRAAADGTLTWMHVLNEEVCEAFAETDEAALRTELVQVAASALRWIRAIDTRASG
jgi:hypothetical protein